MCIPRSCRQKSSEDSRPRHRFCSLAVATSKKAMTVEASGRYTEWLASNSSHATSRLNPGQSLRFPAQRDAFAMLTYPAPAAWIVPAFHHHDSWPLPHKLCQYRWRQKDVAGRGMCKVPSRGYSPVFWSSVRGEGWLRRGLEREAGRISTNIRDFCTRHGDGSRESATDRDARRSLSQGGQDLAPVNSGCRLQLWLGSARPWLRGPAKIGWDGSGLRPEDVEVSLSFVNLTRPLHRWSHGGCVLCLGSQRRCPSRVSPSPQPDWLRTSRVNFLRVDKWHDRTLHMWFMGF